MLSRIVGIGLLLSALTLVGCGGGGGGSGTSTTAACGGNGCALPSTVSAVPPQ
jgi:hypothetical protein